MRVAAQVLSLFFHPVLLPTAGLLLIFSVNSYIAHTTPFEKQLFLITWIFVNTALIPFLFTAVLRWRNLVGSVQLHTREDRIVPFTFALFFYLCNYWLLRDIPMPPVIYSLLFGSSVAVALALIITFFTKVSIHMIGMGGLTAAIYGVAELYHLPITWLVMLGIIASGFVGSARYLLESHSLKQIYLGWVIGFITLYIPVMNGWG